MSGPTQAPVILLAFANDPDDHLNMLSGERKSISEALSQYEDKRYIRVEVEPDAAVQDVFGLFNRFNDQIAIFHYGGHANGSALELETPSGGNEAAQAGGLARLMGLSAGLQLVFLNGCATRGQVKALLENGVKAVIATQVPVDDTMATEFAEQFYQALAGASTIKESFDSACALIATRYDHRREIGDFRGLQMGDDSAPVDAALTWGLYVHPDGEAALAWKLPEQAETEVVISGAAPTGQPGAPVSDGLIGRLFNAIAPFSPEVSVLLEISQRTGTQDLRTVRQMVMDAFPSPVGEQLRKLFVSDTVDEDRLRQLALTYETVAKLFSFALVSQLWNAIYDNPALAITAEQWDSIDAFEKLDEQQQRSFDYPAFFVLVDEILKANGIAPFMTECDRLAEALKDAPSDQAHRSMEQLRSDLAGGKVAAAEMEKACMQAEDALGTLLSDLAFIVGYKLATIKGIAIRKTRHKPAEFSHRQVMLDRVTAGFVDSDEIRVAFTDNESVILLKDVADATHYLNLTPFLIDQNALTGNAKTKIYFYNHYDASQDAYHYLSIADISDRLVISNAMSAAELAIYLPIKGLMEEFRDRVKRP